MATGNSNFDRLATISLQNHGKEIFDAVSTNNALLYMLKKRGNIKIVDGGRSFTHPLYYKQNTSFRAYSKLEAIDTPLMDDVTRAEYPIKVVAGSLAISTYDEATNQGKEKLLDLLDEVKMAAEISMSEVMGDQVFSDGVGANDFDGLQHLINVSPSTQTDVGGINPSDTGNEYWRNYINTTGTAAFNTGSAGLTLMNTALNQTTFGRQGPRAVITTKAIYGLYEIGLTANIRYVTTELADAGFRHLAYTTMPILFDDNCPAARMYFVDTDNLWLQLLAKGNFQVTPFEPSHNQLSKTALMYVFGNLTAGSRRTQGLLTAITG